MALRAALWRGLRLPRRDGFARLHPLPGRPRCRGWGFVRVNLPAQSLGDEQVFQRHAPGAQVALGLRHDFARFRDVFLYLFQRFGLGQALQNGQLRPGHPAWVAKKGNERRFTI